jgi:uncharacterized protein
MAALTDRARRPLNALIKPTSSRCNLDCAYCFYLEKQELYPWQGRPALSVETFERFLRQYAEVSAPTFSLAWQGGEPTLMGLSFFEQAVAVEARVAKETSGGRPATVMNAFQTNGVLLDADWARFLRDWRFLVGVSLDGPPELHDRYRRDRAGRPSHDRVMAGIEHLRSAGVEFNALTVVSRANVEAPRETFRWLVAQGFDNLQFIPCVEPAGGASVLEGGATPESITPAEYGRFLNGVFDAWLEAGFRRVRVRAFDNLVQMLLGMPTESCQLAESCGYVVLEHNGDVYPCDFFVEEHWRLGNVHETTLAEMLVGERFAGFTRLKGHLHSECRACRWLSLCQGECPRYRITATGRAAGERSYFCESYQALFARSYRQLERVAVTVGRELGIAVPTGRLDPSARVGIPLERRVSAGPAASRVGRNDPCPCGSGKKLKHCCGRGG